MSTAAHLQILNNLNSTGDPRKPPVSVRPKPPSRLSPRVMMGVELNILKANSGTSSATSSVAPSPMLSRSFLASSSESTHGSERSVSPQSSVRGQTTGATKLENQLHAYMLWINSQLKKKPGARLVEDLRNDTRDGVAFIDLISVIAGETISGVHPVPSNYPEMKENVERVLHFMSSKKIRMHHIMAKDIVDGNLKSIMRLILALAAHYKPKSVKHSSTTSRSGSGSGSKSPSVTGIAQGASAALAAARRTVAKAGNSFRRKGREHHHHRRRYHQQESSSDQYSDSDTSFHADHPRIIPGRERGDVDGASAGSSPTSSSVNSSHNSIMFSTSAALLSTPVSGSTPVSKSRSADHIAYKDSGTELEDSVFTPARGKTVDRTQYDDLMSEYLKLADAMTIIKKDLSHLQDLLLSGQGPDGEESAPARVIEGSTPSEQIVILRSQLQQSQDVCTDLRDELSKNKLDLMQIQGVKAGLQQRISDQEMEASQLKSELMRRDLQKQNYDSEQANTVKQLHDRDKQISDLRRDIARRDQRIDQLQHELQLQISEKENATKSLKQQVKDLNDRFRVVDETGASLKARVATQDKQMAKLAGRILTTKNEQTWPASTGTDELTVLQDSLTSLRECFTSTDPHQHAIDRLEHGISTLFERLPTSNHTAYNNNGHQGQYDHMVPRKLNFDSTGDVRRSPITAIPGSRQSSFNPSKLDSSPLKPQMCTTKVLYFTDNATTPAMMTVYKRLGEITLHDFIGAFDRPGPYRYHFKSLDPEFGTVKEEISDEEAIIPGWEGKIVAWIEKDLDKIAN